MKNIRGKVYQNATTKVVVTIKDVVFEDGQYYVRYRRHAPIQFWMNHKKHERSDFEKPLIPFMRIYHEY